jgi:colicin import membrane protein
MVPWIIRGAIYLAGPAASRIIRGLGYKRAKPNQVKTAETQGPPIQEINKTGASKLGPATKAVRRNIAEKRAAAEAAKKAKKDRQLPVVQRGTKQPAKTTGKDMVVSKGRNVEVIPPGGRTPTVWKAMPKSTARSAAKDAAGKNRKGWWNKRTPGQKAAIIFATGFGAGAGGLEAFRRWFELGGKEVKAKDKVSRASEIKSDRDIYVRAAEAGPDVPKKAKTRKSVKVVPRPKRKPVKAIEAEKAKRKAAAAREAAAKRKAAAAREAAAEAKNGPKKKTKKAAELSGLEQFWKDVKDLPKYLGTDLLPEQVSGTEGMGPGKRKYKWDAPFVGEVEFELDTTEKAMTEGRKKGGRIKKGVKKTKTRKPKVRRRAALRGHRAERRGG